MVTLPPVSPKIETHAEEERRLEVSRLENLEQEMFLDYPSSAVDTPRGTNRPIVRGCERAVSGSATRSLNVEPLRQSM